MDERSRTGAQPLSTPGRAEILGYGLLAIAVAAGVLYLDGQRPRDIAVIAVAILALLLTLVLIAPRLGEPKEQEAVARGRHGGPTADFGAPPAHGSPGPAWPPDPEPPDPEPPFAPPPIAEPSRPESAGYGRARQTPSGRRAQRGRRRR